MISKLWFFFWGFFSNAQLVDLPASSGVLLAPVTSGIAMASALSGDLVVGVNSGVGFGNAFSGDFKATVTSGQ